MMDSETPLPQASSFVGERSPRLNMLCHRRACCSGSLARSNHLADELRPAIALGHRICAVGQSIGFRNTPSEASAFATTHGSVLEIGPNRWLAGNDIQSKFSSGETRTFG